VGVLVKIFKVWLRVPQNINYDVQVKVEAAHMALSKACEIVHINIEGVQEFSVIHVGETAE
jgi:hypothetical protein